MNRYELTFEWPNGDWTWVYRESPDFHDAMLVALRECPKDCRVHKVMPMPAPAPAPLADGFRTVVFDENGAHDLGVIGPEKIHDVIGEAIDEADERGSEG